MDTPRELLVLGAAVEEKPGVFGEADFAFPEREASEAWFGEVISLAEPQRVMGRLPVEEGASRVWELVLYGALGLCGLLTVGMCFL